MLGLGNSLIHNNRVKRGAVLPSNIIVPVVSGTNTVGSILTTTNGTWIGSTPITYTYQWLRNGSNISGATSSTYTLVTADTSTLVSCKVTATNSLGSANSTSNSLTIYEAEYKAILDYATTNSYTLPSTAQRLKQNTLLSSLKSAGAWTKLDTFVNFATDGSSAFALIDWKRLTQYTAVNSPTFTTNEGFTGNGTSSYINTNFNPTVGTNKYLLNNASRYIYTLNVVNIFDGVELSVENRIGTTGTAQRINQGSGVINSAYSFTTGAGMKSIHRTSSTNVELFSGTTQASRTATSFSIVNANQLISRSLLTYSANRVSMYAMGASLVTENTAFVNAYNTYISSL
jgi:hypothetical protein